MNAAGRIDDAGRALALLLAETDAEAGPLAQALDRANRDRQEVEGRILDEALRSLPEGDLKRLGPALVLASEGWHPGVVGIVASRVVERTGRPTIVLAIDGAEARGSARSIPGLNLHEALARQASLLTRFGGHAAAAGLSLHRDNIDQLRQALCAEVAAQLPVDELGPRCRIDARVHSDVLAEPLVRDLARLRPFGAGNPEPVFALFGVRGAGRALASKRKQGETHLKLRLGVSDGGLDGIGFGMGEHLPVVGAGAFDAAFHLEMDEWQGQQRLQLRLKAVRASV